MADSTLKVEVPGFDATAIAREAIAVKLSEAMIGSEQAIKAIVIAAMGTKVNDRGVCGSNYENKTPFVEWMAQDLIREATKKVLQERVEALRPALEAQIEIQLKRNVKSIAASLTQAFINQAKQGYGVVINMTAEMRVKD